MTKETKSSGLSRKLLWLVILALVGFGLLLYFQRETLEETWQALLEAKLGYVLLLPVLQCLNYFFIGTYYRKMFAQFGTKISVARSWGVVAAMNFVNQVLPSGGLSGITYLAYGFRAAVSTGKTTLIQVGRYMFAFGAYTLLLPLAILVLIQDGRFSDLSSLVSRAAGNTGALITMAIFASIMGLAIASFISHRLSHFLGGMFHSAFNWFTRTILRRKRVYEFNFVKKVSSEFHEGTALVKDKGFKAATPGVFMLLSSFVEVSIVYVSVLAVGSDIGIGPVFLAFVAANIVGVVSVIPGDVGVHEATVIIVLSVFGVDEPMAISATLLYRVFNKMIFLPIGFYFYTKILKPAFEAGEAKA